MTGKQNQTVDNKALRERQRANFSRHAPLVSGPETEQIQESGKMVGEAPIALKSPSSGSESHEIYYKAIKNDAINPFVSGDTRYKR